MVEKYRLESFYDRTDSIATEVLNAVDVLPLTRGEALLMADAEVLEAVEHQPVVAAKAVGVDDPLGTTFVPMSY